MTDMGLGLSMNRKTIISIAAFLVVVAVGTYLVFDLEALTQKEIEFTELLEGQIATALGEEPTRFFPKAGRLPSKFQMGGTPPAVYKLKITTGRRGRRLTFDLSIKRTTEKAQGKFKGRWKHELRAYRLGTLEPVELTSLDPKNSRLAKIRSGGQITGLFFLAQRGRALFGLTLKGIYLKEFDDFEGMLVPILKSIEENGPTLMLESDT